MKTFLIPILVISTMTLLGGCACEVGSGSKQTIVRPTVGQQLIDLQKAKEAGAITDSEFQAQKEKFLGRK